VRLARCDPAHSSFRQIDAKVARWTIFQGDLAMTRMQTLAGLAVFAFTAAGAVISIQAIKPITRTADASASALSRRACADMNGGTFNWSWSNVPFASSCEASHDGKDR
jgi:hypothetical protein